MLPKFAEIISKCLKKARNERYQTIEDLLIDLKEVKRELEFQDKSEKPFPPGKEEQKTEIFKAAAATADDASQTTAGKNRNDSSTIRKSSFNKFAGGALAILLISAIGL